MALPPFLSAVIDWLRAGYPDGVPERDYLPLFALLARQLTENEAHQIAEDLAASGDSATAGQIREAIAEVTHARPRDEDIARVRARLAAGGWPLAAMDRTAGDRSDRASSDPGRA